MYTANLATYFVAKTVTPGIQSVDDLIDQTDVKYGTVADSSVERFFLNSDIDPYKKVGNYLRGKKKFINMVASAEEGYELVRNSSGDYVFIWDELSLEYAVSTDPDCKTKIIGRDFDEGGYGIGMRQGQPYRRNLTLALLKLKEENIIANLIDQWIHPNVSCSDDLDVGESPRVTVEAARTVFGILGVAVFLAILVAAVFACCCKNNPETTSLN